MSDRIKATVRDACGVAGLALAVHGFGLMYRPLYFILGGACLLGGAVAHAWMDR